MCRVRRSRAAASAHAKMETTTSSWTSPSVVTKTINRYSSCQEVAPLPSSSVDGGREEDGRGKISACQHELMFTGGKPSAVLTFEVDHELISTVVLPLGEHGQSMLMGIRPYGVTSEPACGTAASKKKKKNFFWALRTAGWHACTISGKCLKIFYNAVSLQGIWASIHHWYL